MRYEKHDVRLKWGLLQSDNPVLGWSPLRACHILGKALPLERVLRMKTWTTPDSQVVQNFVRIPTRVRLPWKLTVVELITGTTSSLINRVMNFELEAAFLLEPFTASELESVPVFRKELVLITPKNVRMVRTAKDLGRSTMIAFAHGCSYRKRLEDWLGSDNVLPERALEFASYQGMIACVAAGTGFAIVPKSVLVALQATEKVNQHPLPDRFSTNRTHLVWRGQPSLSLEGLIELLQVQGTLSTEVEALSIN